MDKTIVTVLKDSGINFGTSGARGLVVDFTPEVCAAFTKAFTLHIQQHFNFDTVALAIDNRPSSYQMAQSCAAALSEMGINTIYYGVVPTPALAYTAMKAEIPSIMVTGSHIPFDRNGLKFYRPDGEITKDDEQAILTCSSLFTFDFRLVDLHLDTSAYEQYLARYSQFFDKQLLLGKRIGIYEHSSAGRNLYPELFEALGARVICLGRSDEFVPIDTEAVSEADCQLALTWTKEYRLDALFSTDGDGDRPLVAGEDGVWLRGDILGLLASQYLQTDALAVPVSCNSAIELLSGAQCVVRTKIGSPYVIAEFERLAKNYSTIAGFEANGGYLLASTIVNQNKQLGALPTRDALLPFLAVIALAKNNQSQIKELVANLPASFTHSDRLKDFARNKSAKLIANIKSNPISFMNKLGLKEVTVIEINETDGLRLTLSNHDIIHLRPSGNAPELRCYAQSIDMNKAKSLVNLVLTSVV